MLQDPTKLFYEDFKYAYDHWLDAVASEPEGELSEEALNWESLIIKRCVSAVKKHLIPPYLEVKKITRGVESLTLIAPDNRNYWEYIRSWLEVIDHI